MASARVPRDVEIIEATRTAVTAATKVPMINRKPSLLNVFIAIPPYGMRFGFLITSEYAPNQVTNTMMMIHGK